MGMFYRRKVLLALVQVFGGRLSKTDCEKLLFELCKVTGRAHYDFFPHLYGPFSFVSYYDKQRLTELGLLKPSQDFELRVKRPYVQDLDVVDRAGLLAIKELGLRGRRLLRHTYRESPQYAVRSQIIDQLFSKHERKQLGMTRRIESDPAVFTLGYEGRSIDAFLRVLIENNIGAVIDIRRNPQSMKHGFSKSTFRSYLDRAGIQYVSIPELGIPSALRKNLTTVRARENLFSSYTTRMLPQQNAAIDLLKDTIAQWQRVALVCFEADHHQCHRLSLVRYMHARRLLRGPVIHL